MLMPNDRGFSPLLILIAATLVMIVVVGGTYFFQKVKLVNKPIETVEPVSSVPTDQTSIPSSNNDATISTIIQPTPAPIKAPVTQQPLTFSQVTQPDCSSTSCGNTTVLIITGTGFSSSTQLSATGQNNGNPYTGVVSQVNSSGSQIYFDLQSLPCQTYTTSLTNPAPSQNSATFNFYPSKC